MAERGMFLVGQLAIAIAIGAAVFPLWLDRKLAFGRSLSNSFEEFSLNTT